MIAQHTAVTANTVKRKGKPASAKDFLPFRKEKKPDLSASLKAAFMAHNAKVKHGH